MQVFSLFETHETIFTVFNKRASIDRGVAYKENFTKNTSYIAENGITPGIASYIASMVSSWRGPDTLGPLRTTP